MRSAEVRLSNYPLFSCSSSSSGFIFDYENEDDAEDEQPQSSALNAREIRSRTACLESFAS